MANLTDTRYKMQGKTVLYVPNEGTRLSVEEAAKSKEFVQRLESEFNFTVLHVCKKKLYSVLTTFNPTVKIFKILLSRKYIFVDELFS